MKNKQSKYRDTKDLDQQAAPQGERMIELKVRFWTNSIAEGKGVIKRKHAWSSGVVRIERNESHGIEPKEPVPFNSLMELPAVIEKVLIAHGIRIHIHRDMKKYFEVED